MTQLSSLPFPVWKEIEVGTGKNPEVLVQGLRCSGWDVYSLSWNGLLEKIPFDSTPRLLKLVRVKSRELGLAFGRSPYPAVARAARSLNLLPCPPEVGFLLCSQHTPSEGEQFFVDMDFSDEHPNLPLKLIFWVWGPQNPTFPRPVLRTCDVNVTEATYSPEQEWVFVSS